MHPLPAKLEFVTLTKMPNYLFSRTLLLQNQSKLQDLSCSAYRLTNVTPSILLTLKCQETLKSQQVKLYDSLFLNKVLYSESEAIW